MKRRSLLGLLALLLPTLILGMVWYDTSHMASQDEHLRAKASQDAPPHATVPPTPTSTMDQANTFARHGHIHDGATIVLTYDSRPCAQQPSPETCNGVLPLRPHAPLDSRENGSGYCFDHQITIMEDRQISNSAGQTIADFQLWYFNACKSYTTHLITMPGANGQQPTLQLQVSQYAGADEKQPLPSATQAIGPLQDQEIWSPMLYSPEDPVQATMTLLVNQHTSTAVSHYYAAGHPTTIHGQSYSTRLAVAKQENARRSTQSTLRTSPGQGELILPLLKKERKALYDSGRSYWTHAGQPQEHQHSFTPRRTWKSSISRQVAGPWRREPESYEATHPKAACKRDQLVLVS